jgi:hypothetical protein
MRKRRSSRRGKKRAQQRGKDSKAPGPALPAREPQTHRVPPGSRPVLATWVPQDKKSEEDEPC